MPREFAEAEAAIRPTWTKERGDKYFTNYYLDLNPLDAKRNSPTVVISGRDDRFAFTINGQDIVPAVTILGLADAKRYAEAMAVALYAAETLNLSLKNAVNDSWPKTGVITPRP